VKKRHLLPALPAEHRVGFRLDGTAFMITRREFTREASEEQ
jgi:hypothetical protein